MGVPVFVLLMGTFPSPLLDGRWVGRSSIEASFRALHFPHFPSQGHSGESGKGPAIVEPHAGRVDCAAACIAAQYVLPTLPMDSWPRLRQLSINNGRASCLRLASLPSLLDGTEIGFGCKMLHHPHASTSRPFAVWLVLDTRRTDGRGGIAHNISPCVEPSSHTANSTHHILPKQANKQAGLEPNAKTVGPEQNRLSCPGPLPLARVVGALAWRQ